MRGMIRLSVIIPYYNAEPYTSELLDTLNPQILKWEKEVEVLVVDDGSKEPFTTDYPWCRVIRKENGGCASARNVGIENTKGDYIQFIDADDMVAENFITKVMQTIIMYKPDVINLSWKSLTREGAQHYHRLTKITDRLNNPSVCTRTFKRALIGDIRFNELKDSTEDEDFSRKIGYLEHDKNMVQIAITEYMYFYRTAVENSKIKRFKKGIMKTKRVVYYYDHVTKDMTDILEQIKEDDERNEVWLLTNKCDIPELKRYCQIHKPMKMWTHYLKGEKYKNIVIIPVPGEQNTRKLSVILFIHHQNVIGGISTFVYNFCKVMKDHYDITYVIEDAPKEHVEKMKKVVNVIYGKNRQQLSCDVLIMLRILDELPRNITYKKSIQMCHACRFSKRWHIPQNCDEIVCVSEASKKSFGEEAKEAAVIHNPIVSSERKPLILMSATRIPALDKGKNEQRMRQLCEMLKKADIPFMWLNFSDGKLADAPRGFFNMGLDMYAADYFKNADYVVLLSDLEAWPYVMLEALVQNKPVITTDYESAHEMGIEDGVNGYILPFDMNFDVRKLLNIPKFEYEYDNEQIIKSWQDIISKEPKIQKEELKMPIDDSDLVKVIVKIPYKDMEIGQFLRQGQIIECSKERAEQLINRDVPLVKYKEV